MQINVGCFYFIKDSFFDIIDDPELMKNKENGKVYSNGECFCDIVLENISKASGLKELKEQYEFDKVISFGDSENDLPLAEVSDEFCNNYLQKLKFMI